MVLLDGRSCDDACVKELTNDRVEKHDRVQREHDCEEGHREALESLSDLTEVLQLPEETQKAQVAQKQRDRDVACNFDLGFILDGQIEHCDDLHSNLQEQLSEVLCFFHYTTEAKDDDV